MIIVSYAIRTWVAYREVNTTIWKIQRIWKKWRSLDDILPFGNTRGHKSENCQAVKLYRIGIFCIFVVSMLVWCSVPQWRGLIHCYSSDKEQNVLLDSFVWHRVFQSWMAAFDIEGKLKQSTGLILCKDASIVVLDSRQFHSLWPKLNGRHFVNDISELTFLDGNRI